MNKKLNVTIVSVLAGLVFTVFGMHVKADDSKYTTVSVPEAKYEIKQTALKGDNLSVFETTKLGFTITKDVSDFTLKLEGSDVSTLIKSDEYLFIAVLDKVKGAVTQFVKVEKKDGEYTCKFDLPYYADMVELHLYKQKKSDPDFTPTSENFIAKTEIFSPTIDCFYTYGSEPTNHIPILDKDGKKIDDLSDKSTTLVKYTPNFFGIQTTNADILSVDDKFLVIKLPEDKKDLMPEDDKFLAVQSFKPNYADDQQYGVSWEFTCANFYIPKDIDEFEVYCYSKKISDENFKWKCKIKLNRVY